jgi:hypothetical protein
VCIDPADAGPHETGRLHEGEHLVVVGNDGPRQLRKQSEKLLPPREATAGELPDDERMAKHLYGVEPCRQARVSAPEVVHPDRSINEDHHSW